MNRPNPTWESSYILSMHRSSSRAAVKTVFKSFINKEMTISLNLSSFICHSPVSTSYLVAYCYVPPYSPFFFPLFFIPSFCRHKQRLCYIPMVFLHSASNLRILHICFQPTNPQFILCISKIGFLGFCVQFGFQLGSH